MSWLENAVVYHIFIDRFAGYDPAKDWRNAEPMGGNLRGIIEKFDYIRGLGVNTVWISPFYQSTSFHGYNITDFYSMDQRYGTERDLAELIDLAHQNGMKIIADIVPNHVSEKHPYFVDARQNERSPYRDWFLFDHWPDSYTPFITFGSMPKLNLHNPDALAHVLGAARKWLELGLDGYRIDHVVGLSNDTVEALFGRLRQEFPGHVFFGEAAIIWQDGEPATSIIPRRGVHTLGIPHRYIIWALRQYGLNMAYRNYIGRLDGMLDFYFTHHMARFAHTKNQAKRRRIMAKLRRHIAQYPPGFLVTFLDNHDLTRYLFRCRGDVETLLAAAEFHLSLPGPRAIYYGTEVGMSQEQAFLDAPVRYDIHARMPMPWDPAQQNQTVLERYKQIIAEHTKR